MLKCIRLSPILFLFQFIINCDSCNLLLDILTLVRKDSANVVHTCIAVSL